MYRKRAFIRFLRKETSTPPLFCTINPALFVVRQKKNIYFIRHRAFSSYTVCYLIHIIECMPHTQCAPNLNDINKQPSRHARLGKLVENCHKFQWAYVKEEIIFKYSHNVIFK